MESLTKKELAQKGEEIFLRIKKEIKSKKNLQIPTSYPVILSITDGHINVWIIPKSEENKKWVTVFQNQIGNRQTAQEAICLYLHQNKKRYFDGENGDPDIVKIGRIYSSEDYNIVTFVISD